MQKWKYQSIAILTILWMVAYVHVVGASTILFESDGSSLSDFPCHYLSWGNSPAINTSDGNPAPSIQFDASSNEVATYSFAPYTLPSLSYGQVLHGSQNIKITGANNYIEIAGFGMSIADNCNYDPYGGPADGRFPLPSIYYDSDKKQIYSYFRNSSQQLETTSKSYDLSINVWHQVDFSFTPSSDGSYYDFELKIDNNVVITGKSYEKLYANDALGVIIGVVGSYRATNVLYDNIKVEITENTNSSVLSVSPSTQNVSLSSGTTSFAVSNTGSGTMSWTASVTSGSSWLSITSGASGSNSGTITCSYSSNTSKASRIGTIRVTASGATGSPVDVTVSQQETGADACTSTIDSNLVLHIPYATYIHPLLGPLYFYTDMVYELDLYAIIFKMTTLEVYTETPPNFCTPATLSSSYDLHAPDVLLPDGITHVWLDLRLDTTRSTEYIYFVVTNFGEVAN